MEVVTNSVKSIKEIEPHASWLRKQRVEKEVDKSRNMASPHARIAHVLLLLSQCVNREYIFF
jgi:hypothetical protein